MLVPSHDPTHKRGQPPKIALFDVRWKLVRALSTIDLNDLTHTSVTRPQEGIIEGQPANIGIIDIKLKVVVSFMKQLTKSDLTLAPTAASTPALNATPKRDP